MPLQGFGILLLLCFSVVSRGAGLDWPVRVIELKADLAGKGVVAVFPCKNNGDKSVVITSVIPSCGCLTPKLAKEFFAPGESGELRAEFAIEGTSGRVENTLTVTTDDATQAPIVLKVIVTIAEPVALSARSVFWEVGEPNSEKVIELIFAEPEKSVLVGVQCAEASFAIRQEPGTAPGRYRIAIRPVGTASVAQAMIRLATEINGQSRVCLVQVGVR